MGVPCCRPRTGGLGQERLLFFFNMCSAAVRKIFQGKAQAGGQKGRGWGEGIFARPSGKVLIKNQNLDFRQKKFGF